MKALKKTGKIKKEIMSCSLGDVNLNQESYVIFGDVNPQQYVGNFYDFSLVSNSEWGVELTQLSYGDRIIKKFANAINGEEPSAQSPNSALGILDTGST